MDVRPDHEQREREPDPPRRVPCLRGEEPEEARVQRKRQHLRPDRPRPGCGDEHGQEHHPDRACSRPELTRRRSGDRERRDDERRRRKREQREAAEAVRAVHEDLGEPLLVGPRRTEAVHRDLVPARQPVLHHLSPGHEVEPAVVHDERGREDQQEDQAESGHEDDEDVLLLGDSSDGSHRLALIGRRGRFGQARGQVRGQVPRRVRRPAGRTARDTTYSSA